MGETGVRNAALWQTIVMLQLIVGWNDWRIVYQKLIPGHMAKRAPGLLAVQI